MARRGSLAAAIWSETQALVQALWLNAINSPRRRTRWSLASLPAWSINFFSASLFLFSFGVVVPFFAVASSRFELAWEDYIRLDKALELGEMVSSSFYVLARR